MRTNSSVFVGDRFETKSCGWAEVVAYLSARQVYIQFEHSGYVKRTAATYVRSGVVEDPFYPLVKGVGYVGVGKYKPKEEGRMTKAHSVWFQILRRCYDKNYSAYKIYGEKGCIVCPEWHNFQNFAEWYYKNHKEGLAVDKDILKRGNKVYCPDYCTFVPIRINSLLTSRTADRGILPVGVCFDKNHKGKLTGKFAVSMSGGTTQASVFLGYFEDMQDAFVAYKNAKEQHIAKVANEEYLAGNITKEVYESLLNWEVVPFP